MVDFTDILKFIVHTDNPIIFHTYQVHGKNLYFYDEYNGWRLDVTDEKIINLLFDIVKNLDKQNKEYKNLMIELHNTMSKHIILINQGD